MKSVTPDELAAHRAFFTEFDRYGDPSKWATPAERDVLQRQLERKLKIFLITKAHVLVAASQLLESPFAHELIRKHPNLLISGAIISSIKLGHESSSQFLLEKRDEDREKPRSPYHTTEAFETAQLIDTIGTSVRWPLSAMSDWFRMRLADDLSDEQSLVRIALRRAGVIPSSSVVAEIRAEEGLSRRAVDRIVAATNDTRFRDIMRLYADFIYYLSGARATRSEGVLPQENLVDYSLGELIGRKTRLSEHEIFFKIFMDIVKARTATVFPDEFLDAISIDDALELRHVAISKKFTAKYNTIQEKTKEALDVEDPEGLVLLLAELDTFENELHDEFEAELDRELPTRAIEERQRASGKVLQAVASIFIPGYGPDSYKDIVVSGLKWMGRDEAAAAIERKINKGLFACETALESMQLLERQALLDFVDTMKAKYQERMFQARR